jgi:single-strand DNA-binding protein
MSEFKTSGKLIAIFPTEYRGEKQFATRNFAIEIEGQYPQQVQFQCTQERCNILDNYAKGQEVEVSFDLRGRAYEKDGVTKYFTTLNAWRVKKVGEQPAQQPQQAAPAASQAPPAPAKDTAADIFGYTEDLPF